MNIIAHIFLQKLYERTLEKTRSRSVWKTSETENPSAFLMFALWIKLGNFSSRNASEKEFLSWLFSSVWYIIWVAPFLVYYEVWSLLYNTKEQVPFTCQEAYLIEKVSWFYRVLAGFFRWESWVLKWCYLFQHICKPPLNENGCVMVMCDFELYWMKLYGLITQHHKICLI